MPPQITPAVLNKFLPNEEWKHVDSETEAAPPFTISQAVQKLPCSLVPIDSKLDVIQKLNSQNAEYISKFLEHERNIDDDFSNLQSTIWSSQRANQQSNDQSNGVDWIIDQKIKEMIKKHKDFNTKHLFTLHEIEDQINT